MRAAAWVTVALVGSACRTSSPPAAGDAPHPEAAPPPSAGAMGAAVPTDASRTSTAPGSHDCATDQDCTSSCRHGAVNRRWWEAQYPGDEACEGGCTAKGTDPPRCEQGKCRAYFMGEPSAACSEKQESVIPGPGPAHRCQADSDCKISCRYGAVNASWYSWGAQGDCKDGCADGQTTRCEAGACVALLNGRPFPGCTRKSIHEKP